MGKFNKYVTCQSHDSSVSIVLGYRLFWSLDIK